MGHWRSLYRYSATSLRSSGGSGSPPRFRREREANPLRVSLVPIAELDDVNSRGDPQLPGHREPAMPDENHAAFVLNRRKVSSQPWVRIDSRSSVRSPRSRCMFSDQRPPLIGLNGSPNR